MQKLDLILENSPGYICIILRHHILSFNKKDQFTLSSFNHPNNKLIIKIFPHTMTFRKSNVTKK